jgi:GNAT superfamily N-acetyltransferase
MDTDLTFRVATETDAPAAAKIIDVALSDLLVRQGRPPLDGPEDEDAPVLVHLMTSDPGRFWLAVDGDRPVGVGAGFVRESLWFLAALFVLPEWQARGVGRRLLQLAKEDHPRPAEVAALTSSASNPISNRLYARHGIYPRLPLLYMKGSPAAARPGRGALDMESLTPAHIDELREIDAAVTGIDRTVDHTWLLGDAARRGWLYRRRGRLVGYAYLGGDGTEGAAPRAPPATLRAQDQDPVIRLSLAELAAQGAEEAVLIVPGPNLHAQRLLWEAGFSFDGSAGLLCASKPFGRFDRYLLAGDCLM